MRNWPHRLKGRDPPVGQQLDLAVVMFHQGRTILDPIAAIIISRIADLSDDRTVDVPAEHSLNMVALGITSNCVFVGADETDRVFHPLLDRFAERPITESNNPADGIYERIESEEKLVADIAEKGEPLDILHHGVELVPMQDEDPASVGRNVKCVFLNRDRAVSAEMTGEKLIMIAWNVNDPRPFAGLAQNLLNHVVMLLRPVNATFERPDVDQITDDVERVELVFLEEGKERRGITTAGPEMDVRNPSGTIAVRAISYHELSVTKAKGASKSSIVTFVRQRYIWEMPAKKGQRLTRCEGMANISRSDR